MAQGQPEPFADRSDAGRALARQLQHYAGRPDVVVLALPRGGVPVGFEIAAELGVRLDVFLVRKLGVPQQPELAMGAIASGGVRVLNDDVVRWASIDEGTIASVERTERAELERRERRYRHGQPPLDVRGQTVILVDDGLATGSTMLAAVQAARELGPSRVVVAAPVGAPETCQVLAGLADEVICVETPRAFRAVGEWYLDFSQTSDEEVDALLARAASSAVHGAVQR